MSDVVIQVDQLGKKFRRGARPAYGRFSELLVNGSRACAQWAYRQASSLFVHRADRAAELAENEFWALKDVSFEVKRGEVLGIIGRNGAGKSTLLKLLSRITRPTTGEIRLRGRVGSLLEVGTGFHPELTGRENVYLNGTILGMRKREIDRRFDEIVAFAEIDQFLDTPVKHYSSGMYMRLAFAVAAHLEPEILVVDEVLAVGDAEFQKKCLGKMGEVARGGRTVLFVSHNMTAVRSLCAQGILLRAGHVQGRGDAASLVAEYVRVSDRERQLVFIPATESAGPVRLEGLRVVPASCTTASITNGTELAVEAIIWLAASTNLSACIAVWREGDLGFIANTYHDNRPLQSVGPGRLQIRFRLPAYLLNPGSHSVAFYVADSRGAHDHYIRCEERIALYVEDDGRRRGGLYAGAWAGAVCPLLHTMVEPLEVAPAWLAAEAQLA